MFSIYCDESCHLPDDDSNIMVLGAISCPLDKVKEVSQDIKSLKNDFGLSTNFEIKWTKVSPSKIEFYESLIDYFWNNYNLKFRSVVATNKNKLKFDMMDTYDDWYYKMYYLLLSKMLDPIKQYNVYLDIKDTNGGPKIKKLHKIINGFLYKFSYNSLNNIQIIRSHESQILQLCDLLIGAIGYKNRFLKSGQPCRESLSKAKVNLCNKLANCSGRTLEHSTPLSEEKLNLFIWEPQESI